MVSKRFPRKRVAQVSLDKRDMDREKRITERNARMGECARVQDDEVDPVGRSLLHAVDELVFGITLETGERVAEPCGELDTACLDVVEAGCAVDIGLARAQQVEVGPVDQQEIGHRWLVPSMIAGDGGNSNPFCRTLRNICTPLQLGISYLISARRKVADPYLGARGV